MFGRPSCTLRTVCTLREACPRVWAVPAVAISSKPSSIKRAATGTRDDLSRSWVDRKTVPWVGRASPAPSSALAYAIPKLVAEPITSPVDRISGPSTVSAPGKRRKGSTASLIACRGGWGSSVSPTSARDSPAINRVAKRASGFPVALATKGTVREARGFASMMKTTS